MKKLSNVNIYKYILVCLWAAVFSLSTYAQSWNSSFTIGTVSGNYSFAYNQTPDQLVEIYPAAIPNTGLSYQWQQSSTPLASGFTNISGATQSSYSFPSPLTQTTYFRKMVTSSTLGTIYSNIIKISVVSVNWEDYNYVREHDILVTGQNDWQTIDQLSIGQKLQTTTYLDGLGRPIEKVSRETATPSSGNLWSDIVQFSIFDKYGRDSLKFLPYTTANQSGKFKTTPLTDQTSYYSSVYNETSAYSKVTYDNSPLNRITNVKEPGSVWAASAGKSAAYDVNTTSDSVVIFTADYVEGDAPVVNGYYPAGTLYKLTYIDEYSHQVVEFTDKSGELILKKVQIDNSPATGHTGWVCTYNVYDDFGLLRFQIQPEGVKWLNGNGWNFGSSFGPTILAEQCFQYFYDDKGRMIWKKAPGAQPLNMLYDVRDRIVFMQDGNQAVLSTPQWTANLYDNLDRLAITCLYNTTQSITTLQTNINNATTINNLYLDPISSSDLNNPSVCTILKYLYYDNYNFSGVKSFNTGFTNTNAYSPSDPNVIPIATSQRVLSYPTGSSVRVLGSNMFLNSTEYYDEKGRHIQTLEDNIKTGIDITTDQYHWNGTLLSSCSDHTTTGTGYTHFITLTKYLFDKIGRVTSIQKQYGSNAMATVANYDYDDIGRVKTKHYGPNYNNPNSGLPDLESLDYSFNIHNQITGINKDFALKNSGYNKWQHFFGMYLGYDNKDAAFAASRLNGQIAGIMWNTQGDDAQRKYDYSYDNADRFIKAAFNEQAAPGAGWSNAKMDFSILGNGDNQTIQYDYNGNLQNMVHKGVLPGQGVVTVDNLTYTYNVYSNKLKSVTDNGNLGTMNGLLGDFKDGTNATGTPDYVYDANGNVVVDLNKNATDLGGVTGANGVHYNYLDKPDQVRIKGKGYIQIVYDADGSKLQKIYTLENTSTATVTSYINEFVYTDTLVPSNSLTGVSTIPTSGGIDMLSFINFEEGRIRVITPYTGSLQDGQGHTLDAETIDGNLTLPNNFKGVYDFFIRDYQQNTRAVITEETHWSYSTATMEPSLASFEDGIFGQQGTNNEVEKTRATKPPGWASNTSSYVSMLQPTSLGGQSAIGPNVLLKVMAGDQLSATTQYYYQSIANNNNSSLLSDILSSLSAVITTGSAANSLVKVESGSIINNLSPANNIPLNSIADPNQYTGDNIPRAYLEILFFDERFNFVSENSQVLRVSQQGDNAPQLVLPNIKAPKNGYVYVFVSNESNIPVYFDNLKVNFTRGNLIEENHYYAYGLKIAGISSKELGEQYEGSLKNLYQYQGDFSEMDEDIGWNDFELRNYDAQIGRWVQMDPYDQYPSPYMGLGNDPMNGIDPDGGFAVDFGVIGQITGSVLADRALVTLGGAAVGYIVDKLSGGNGWTGAAIGGGVALGGTFVPPFEVALGDFEIILNGAGKVGQIVNQATTFKSINGQIETAGAGAESIAQRVPQQIITTGRETPSIPETVTPTNLPNPVTVTPNTITQKLQTKNQQNNSSQTNNNDSYNGKVISNTWDPITNIKIERLDPRVQLPATTFINRTQNELGIRLRIAQGLRTIEEQNHLYAQGRTTLGKVVTNAKGGQSYHNFGLAIDVYIIQPNGSINYDQIVPPKVVEIARQEGFEWGGNWRTFKDYPHFQMTFGQTLQQLRLQHGIH